MSEFYELKYIKKSLNTLRSRHPVPQERVLQLKNDQLKHFVATVRRVQPKQMPDFIASLSYADYPYIFEALSYVEDLNTINRLNAIIQNHVGWTMYTYGLFAYQNTFPNPTVHNAFSVLCKHLVNNSQPMPRYIKKNVIKMMADAKNPEDFLPAFYTHFENLSLNLLPKNLGLYQVAIHSFLGQQVLLEYLQSCPMDEFSKSLPYMNEILRSCPPIKAERLLERIKSIPTVHEKSNFIAFINKMASPLFPVSDFWKSINPNLYEFFRLSEVQKRILLHFSSSNKTEFFMEYAPYISDIAVVSDTIKAFRFETFVIIDDANISDYSYFYQNSALQNIFNQGYAQDALIDPPFPVPTLSNSMSTPTMLQAAMLKINLSIPFIPYAKDFFNLKLRKKQN